MNPLATILRYNQVKGQYEYLQLTGEDVSEIKQELEEHKADDTIHKTSDVIRAETETKLKVEVVSSSESETPEQGRIIFDVSQGKFFGGTGSEWV